MTKNNDGVGVKNNQPMQQ